MNAPTRAVLTVAAIAAAAVGGWYYGSHQGSSSSSSASTTATAAGDQQYLQALGWLMGRQPVKLLGLSADDIDQVAIGMKSVLTQGIVDPPGGEDAITKAQKYLQDRQDTTAKADAAKLDGLQKDLFAKLDKDSTIKKTASGLYYQIITPGTDPKPAKDALVSVNYTGKFANDEVFDKTNDKEGPRDLQLDQVVPGWQEGLQLIGKGGKIKLWIPGNIGFGETSDRPGMPANATLIFDVELVDIKAAPPPTAAGADGMQGIPPELMQQILAAQAAKGDSSGTAPKSDATVAPLPPTPALPPMPDASPVTPTPPAVTGK